MPTRKTPGVYIVEKNAFPNSVIKVATSIPVFVGYTEKAARGNVPIAGVPTRITSLVEYHDLFGGPPPWRYRRVTTGGTDRFEPIGQRYYLYQSLRLFFDNGGGACWIVSVGGYGAAVHGAGDFADAVWQRLEAEPEPSICLVPDAVSLDRAGYKAATEAMLRHCQKIRSRVAILDVFDGRGPDLDAALNAPNDGFRNLIGFGDDPSFGAAYAPWLNTNVISSADLLFTALDADSRDVLADEISAELVAQAAGKPLSDAVTDLIEALRTPPEDITAVNRAQQGLQSVSTRFRDVMTALLAEVNTLPPSGAIAGVYARTDASEGVFKAPANTGLMSVLSPCVAIDDRMQQDMNAPPGGHAVNAIRAFPGRGTLIWGARTLDANSAEFRYVNVRRTLIMIEQSVQAAIRAYVFEPNDANTWLTVQNLIGNFLNNQWKAGALAGPSPDDAYSVQVGLGSTMTARDIQTGILRVTVAVALMRPAEFIVINIEQKMQTS